MSYRQFCIFADDGEINLGTPCALPSDMEPFPDKGTLFPVEIVASGLKELARRTLVSTVLPNVLAKKHRGIGALSSQGSCGSEPPTRLLPHAVDSFRRMRLLTRRNEGEPVCREQVSYMKPVSLATMNGALSKIVPVATVPSSEKLPYGKK